MKIHHIGYLVKKVDKGIQTFESLGYEKKSEILYDENRKIDICFLEKDGYLIELVSPKDRSSVVYNLLKQYKNSPYHICYETDDFEEDMMELEMNGYVKVDNPCPAPAIDGKRVVFLLNAAIGLIELVEK